MCNTKFLIEVQSYNKTKCKLYKNTITNKYFLEYDGAVYEIDDEKFELVGDNGTNVKASQKEPLESLPVALKVLFEINQYAVIIHINTQTKSMIVDQDFIIKK
nr:hypothetical protein [uncultured Niameybacter sp.]